MTNIGANDEGWHAEMARWPSRFWSNRTSVGSTKLAIDLEANIAEIL